MLRLHLKVNADWAEEVNMDFLQRMADSMGMSFFKYGRIQDAYPTKVNAIESLKQRLAKYEQTGNSDFLVDVANFAMIEATFPAHKDAHYRFTDSNESPGRKFNGELDASKRGNKEI